MKSCAVDNHVSGLFSSINGNQETAQSCDKDRQRHSCHTNTGHVMSVEASLKQKNAYREIPIPGPSLEITSFFNQFIENFKEIILAYCTRVLCYFWIGISDHSLLC